MKCENCGKIGHLKKDCWSLKGGKGLIKLKSSKASGTFVQLSRWKLETVIRTWKITIQTQSQNLLETLTARSTKKR